MELKKLGIFCGSSLPTNKKLVNEIHRFLSNLFEKGTYDVVYGGASIGLMGMVADIALKNSRFVYGVMPEFLIKREVDHKSLSDFETCDTMHIRKEKMYLLSDAFLILPGGFGTLDEFFEILTWRQLNLHQKPIYLLNSLGFYDHLISHVNNLSQHGLIAKTDGKLIKVIKKADELK